MGIGSGFYMYDVIVKRSHSLSHLLMSSCFNWNSLLIICICKFQKKTFSVKLHKTVAIPVGFHSKDEMLGCRVHAVDKYSISTMFNIVL